MANIQDVYDAFLARVQDDEWSQWLISEAEQDWAQLYNAALPWFKFPRVSFETDANGDFIDEVGNAEIQIIATYMKCEWLNRCIMTWENVKPLYEERDFSQANLLDKLGDTLTRERSQALDLESLYYRSVNHKPFDFSQLAKQ